MTTDNEQRPLSVFLSSLREGEGTCEHCEVRYDRLALPHAASWLLHWPGNHNAMCAWLVCDAQLSHALQTMRSHRTREAFLTALRSPTSAAELDALARGGSS